MVGRLLDINGLVVDRDRTRLLGETPGFHWVQFMDEEGRMVADITVEPRVGWVNLLLWTREPSGMSCLDSEGWTISGGRRSVCWAPLLDLAVEAGLELPKVVRLPRP
jgi:hypothetical protein